MKSTLFEKSNFCPKIQFWPNRVFHPNFFWQFFSWNQSCQQLKSPKPQHFHEFFIPKKSTIFSGNQSWIFGQKMKVSNSVNHMHSDYRLCMQYVSSTQPRILTWHNFDDTKLSRHNFRLSHFLMLLLIFTRFIISRIVNHQEDQVVCVMFIFLNAGSSASTNFSTLFPGYSVRLACLYCFWGKMSIKCKHSCYSSTNSPKSERRSATHTFTVPSYLFVKKWRVKPLWYALCILSIRLAILAPLDTMITKA